MHKWLHFFIIYFLFCRANISASPIVGDCASTLPRQGVRVNTHLICCYLPSEGYIFLSISEVYYGFVDPLTIKALLPAVIITGSDNYGVGDVVLDFKYKIYDPSKELGYTGVIYPTFSLVGGARLGILKPLKQVQGQDDSTGLFPLTRWAGRGSTDLKLGLLTRLGNSRGAFNLGLNYWFNLDNKQADEFVYWLGVESPLIFNKIAMVLELLGSKDGRNYSVEVCPGIQYSIQYGRGERLRRKVEHEFIIESSFLIPVKFEGSCTTNVIPFMGVSWTF